MRLTLSAFFVAIMASSAMAQMTKSEVTAPVSDAELQAILDRANEGVDAQRPDQAVGYTLPLKQISLYEGQSETLRAAEPPRAAKPPRTHVIAQGDTLYGLSKRYDVTIAALQQANALKDYRLALGDIIRIPDTQSLQVQPEPIKPEPARADIQAAHIVQPGDTLYGIAKHYCITGAALNAANPSLRADRLPIGATIVLPQGYCRAKIVANR